jgi:hypothetical protein
MALNGLIQQAAQGLGLDVVGLGGWVRHGGKS